MKNKKMIIHGPCVDGKCYWIPSDMKGEHEPNCERVEVKCDRNCKKCNK